MKKLSDFTKKPLINESIVPMDSDTNDSGYNVFLRIQKHSMDNYVYKDEKLTKLSVIYKNQLNKKCRKSFEIYPLVVTVNNDKGVLLYDENEVVIIIPNVGGTGISALQYYNAFERDSETNTATFELSSQKIGIVKMIDTFVLFINNYGVIDMNVNESIKLKKNSSIGNYDVYTTSQGASTAYTNFYNNLSSKLSENYLPNVASERDNYMNDLCEFIKNNIDSIDWNSFVNDLISFGKDITNVRKANKIPNEYISTKQQIIENEESIKDFYRNTVCVNYPKFDEWWWLFAAKGTDRATESFIAGCAAKAFGRKPSSVIIVSEKQANVSTEGSENLLTEDEIEKETRRIEELKDKLRNITRRKIEFVKSTQAQKLEYIRKYKFSQVAIIIGKGGVGKTSIVKNVIRDEFGIDMLDSTTNHKYYCELGGGNTTAESLYKFFWANNGKLIVLDDCANLFEGKYNLTMWKHLLPGEGNDFGAMNVPKANERDEGSSTSNYYDPSSTIGNNRARYYLEVGKRKGRGINDKREFVGAKIPTSYKFNGAIIIIANDTYDAYEKQLGLEHWRALKSRGDAENYDPAGWYIKKDIMETFAKMKEGLDERGNPYPDPSLIPIPQEYIEDVMEIVDEVACSPGHDNVNYRLIDRLINRIWTDNGFVRENVYSTVFSQTNEDSKNSK